MDPDAITEILLNAARSVGAEVTSPWFYLQLGLIGARNPYPRWRTSG